MRSIQMKRTVLRFYLLFLFALTSVLQAEGPIRVALYKDGGVSGTYTNVQKTVEEDPAFELTLVNGQQIRDGILDQFEIVIFPGGSGRGEAASLQPEGVKKVKEFIKSGKSYVGICAGAYLPIQQDFLNAEFRDPAWQRGVTELKIEFSPLGQKLVGDEFKGEVEIRYGNGPVVNINPIPTRPRCEVLAWYRSEVANNGTKPGIQINSPAILLSTYGRGMILTFSPHPEHNQATHGILLKLLHHVADHAQFGKPEEETIREKNAPVSQERLQAVERMRAQAEVEWIPQSDLTWFIPRMGVIFHAGERYKGLPYTQGGRRTSLEDFQALLKEENGQPIYTGPTSPKEYRGTDCSGGCSYAWRHVIPVFPVMKTWDMEPGFYSRINPETGVPEPWLMRVGHWKMTDFHDSRAVVKENGPEVMAACYDQLLPGDWLVKRPDGHVRMVSRVEPENRKVFVIEQTGLTPDGKLKSDHQSWRVDYAFTYDELMRDGYLPVTVKETMK